MKKCKRCRLVKNQVCQLSNIGFFAVNKAIRIIKRKPRRKYKISSRRLYFLTKNTKILKESKSHLSHVNLSLPGILGQTETHSFLLDGNHRALWHRINKKPFYAYILTGFETGQTMLETTKNKKFI